MESKFHGRNLFSPTMTSGEAKEIPIQNSFDLSINANKNGSSHVVVAQSVDIGTNAGTISFRSIQEQMAIVTGYGLAMSVYLVQVVNIQDQQLRSWSTL